MEEASASRLVLRDCLLPVRRTVLVGRASAVSEYLAVAAFAG